MALVDSRCCRAVGVGSLSVDFFMTAHSMEPKQETMEAEGWTRKFLRKGTENGCGDLSIMVGTVSECITHAIEAHDKMLAEKVKELPLVGVQGNSIGRDDVLDLLNKQI